MINWFKKKPPKSNIIKLIRRKVTVKVCQLYAHVGLQKYKYRIPYEYDVDPFHTGEAYQEHCIINKNEIIPFHKIDKIEAVTYEEEREIEEIVRG